ncbi:MAG: hypothetical protein MPF33_04220 [Candidatus Aramenus sp.]|nr:hypothetical protein [Candidatus Aramenus sp.]
MIGQLFQGDVESVMRQYDIREEFREAVVDYLSCLDVYSLRTRTGSTTKR